MTLFDLRSWVGDGSIGPDLGPLPYMEIDQDSMQYNSQRIFFNATYFDPVTGAHEGQYTMYGKFSGFFTSNFFRSRLTGLNMAFKDYGAVAIGGFDISAAESQNPTSLWRTLLNSSDTYYGTRAGDRIDLSGGNDAAYGFDGDDQFVDSQGVNSAYGGAGSDSFYAYTGRGIFTSSRSSSGYLVGVYSSKKKGKSKKTYAYDPDVLIVEDFQAGVDKLFVQGSPAGYFVDFDGSDSWIMNNADNNLVAVVKGVDAGIVDVLGF